VRCAGSDIGNLDEKEKDVNNPKGRRTDDEESSSVRNRRRHWASVLREVKQRWSEDMIQEQARLLAAYHHVGSMRAPRWVKWRSIHIWNGTPDSKIMLMLALTWVMTRKYRRSGFWVPERGIFWEIDSATEDSSESDESDESTDRSDSGELEDR
jgi:hypothetical protein